MENLRFKVKTSMIKRLIIIEVNYLVNFVTCDVNVDRCCVLMFIGFLISVCMLS